MVETRTNVVSMVAFESRVLKNVIRIVEGREIDRVVAEDELTELMDYLCLSVPKYVTTGLARHRVDLLQNSRKLYEVTMLECEMRRRIAAGGAPPFSTLLELGCSVTSVPAPNVPRLLPTLSRERVTFERRKPVPKVIEGLLQLGNVVIAGGAALNHVTGHYIDQSSDVDIFIWGLDEQQADAKLMEVLRLLDGKAIKSDNAVNIMAAGILYQVVLRLYSSPDEVLHGFDIQACKVCLTWQGTRVVAHCTPSFEAAMQLKAVWVDPERQSQSYAARLVKYWTKGFDVLLFGLDRSDIDPEVFGLPIAQLHGMAKLLRLEREIRCSHQDAGLSSACLWRVRRVIRRTKVMVEDYAVEASFFGKLYALVQCFMVDVLHYFTPLPEKRGLRGVKAIDVVWRKRDPGSQTVIGSFHPEEECFYAML